MKSERPCHCCMCDKLMVVQSSTTTDPECPEMIQVPQDVAIGFVMGDLHPEMIFTCSEQCLEHLMRES